MTHEPDFLQDSVGLRRKRLLCRAKAFVITACVAFILMSLTWPLGVTSYQSQIRVVVRIGNSLGAEQEFRHLLASAIRSQTSDLQMENLISQAHELSGIDGLDLSDDDVKRLRNRISVRAAPHSAGGINSGQMIVDFALEGRGLPHEQAMVRRFSDSISTALLDVAAGTDLEDALAVSGGGRSNNQAIGQIRQIGQLDWLACQIQDDIEEVSGRLAELATDPAPRRGFLNASYASSNSIPNSNSPSASRSESLLAVQEAVDGIDIASLREQLDHLQQSPDVPWDEGNMSHREVALRGGSDVGSMSTFPVGAVPENGQLLLMGVVSLALGSIIAVNFVPFFRGGFSSVSRLANQIQIPVAAVFALDQSNDEETSVLTVPWANRCVQIAKGAVFVLAAVVLVFCIANAEVRGAFSENPFHGMAKIAWVMFGR